MTQTFYDQLVRAATFEGITTAPPYPFRRDGSSAITGFMYGWGNDLLRIVARAAILSEDRQGLLAELANCEQIAAPTFNLLV